MAQLTRFRLEIELSNAAFHPHPGPEIARILRHAADRAEGAKLSQPKLSDHLRLFDTNGNGVGYMEYQP